MIFADSSQRQVLANSDIRPPISSVSDQSLAVVRLVGIRSMAGDLLATDQHPFAGQDARLAHDHLFQLLFADEFACGQQRGLGTDLPDGVLNGHEEQVFQRVGPASDRRVNQRENKLSSKCLIFHKFQLPSPLLSSRGEDNDTGLSVALGAHGGIDLVDQRAPKRQTACWMGMSKSGLV